MSAIVASSSLKLISVADKLAGNPIENMTLTRRENKTRWRICFLHRDSGQKSVLAPHGAICLDGCARALSFRNCEVVMSRLLLIPAAIASLMVWSAGAQAQSAQAGQWSEKAPLPTTRNETAAVAVNGKIYLIGGNYP